MRAVFERPGDFDRYIPHFCAKTVFPPRPVGGEFYVRDPVDVPFERAADRDDLWVNAALEPKPGALQCFGDVVERIEAVVPTAEYLALKVDLPGWTVKTCGTDDAAGLKALREEMSGIVNYTEDDLAEWEEFIVLAALRL